MHTSTRDMSPAAGLHSSALAGECLNAKMLAIKADQGIIATSHSLAAAQLGRPGQVWGCTSVAYDECHKTLSYNVKRSKSD